MTTITAPEPVDQQVDDEDIPEAAARFAPPALTGQDLVRYTADDGALTIPTSVNGYVLRFTADQTALTEQQMHLLGAIGIEPHWDPRRVALFLMQCHTRGLDPFRGQAYLLPIDGKLVFHTSIAGYLSRAEATGEYRGLTQTQWCGPDGLWRDVWLDKNNPPSAAKIGVRRSTLDDIEWAVAHYDEYAPIIEEWTWDPEVRGKKNKTGRLRPSKMWRPAAEGGKPAVMLAKVAKALGFREAFPEQCAGFYLTEETEKTREEAAARAEQRDNPDAAAARQAAYDADMAAHAATDGQPFPVFAGAGVSDDAARPWVLAELDEQAAILGLTRQTLTAKQSALRGGAAVEDWALREIADAVRRYRPYVIEKLRAAGRDDQADHYLRAPDVGPVEVLFGRPAAVIDAEDTEPATPRVSAAGAARHIATAIHRNTTTAAVA